MSKYRTLLDRPPTHNIKNFDRMVVELGKYMNEIEMDQCLEFMNTVADSKWDINPTAEDSKTQLQIMFGRERFLELTQKWGQENQQLLSVFGIMKFKEKTTGQYFDGLDPEDNPEDYEKFYI